MRKLLWLLLVSACLAQSTPNLNFNIPSVGTPAWGPLVNANFTLLDSLLSGSGRVALKGFAADATIYVSNAGNDANDGASEGTAKLTMGAAASSCPVSNCVIRVSKGGLTVSSSVVFANTVQLECDERATIAYSSNSNQLQFNGQGSTVTGCGFSGAGSTVSGVPPIVATNNFFVFKNNSVSSFGPTSGSGELSVTKGTNDQITGNIFNVNGDWDIALLNATANQIMYAVTASHNIASDILVSNTGTGASFAAVNINNNILSAGESSKPNPCIKLLSTGTNIADVVITGNNCVLSQAGPTIGYSINNTSSASISGNVYDASGFSGTVDGILLNAVNNIVALGNIVWNSGVGTSVAVAGSSVNVNIGANNIGSAITGVSIGAGPINTRIATQKFASITTNYSDSGTGTDIINRSYSGSVTLAGGTGTFSIPAGGAFTSTSTFFCNTNDTTTVANGSKAVPATSTTATVTGTGTDVVAVTCTGH